MFFRKKKEKMFQRFLSKKKSCKRFEKCLGSPVAECPSIRYLNECSVVHSILH